MSILMFVSHDPLQNGRIEDVTKLGPRKQGRGWGWPLFFVLAVLVQHLESNSLLSKYQFGFRSGRSTELAITYFTDCIRREADRGNLTGAVYIDLSKAFDTISHSCLLDKLPLYGICDVELEWFTDYLFFRKQSVEYNGFLSDPQGSILGPILFLIHFNDVHDHINYSNIITYADDSVLFTSAKNISIIQDNLNKDIKNLSNWFCDNELVINLKKGKTECMLFGTGKRLGMLPENNLVIKIGQNIINFINSYNYLGTPLDPSLLLNTYFDKIYKKAYGRVNLLRRIRKSLTFHGAETIYKTMILPVSLITVLHSLDGVNQRSWK